MTKPVRISYYLPPHDQYKNKLVKKANFINSTSKICNTQSKNRRMHEWLYITTMMNKLIVMSKNIRFYHKKYFTLKAIENMQCSSAGVFYHANVLYRHRSLSQIIYIF